MRRGFTIIEIMVVVVIIGILASIALFQYNKIIDKAKIVSLKANMHSLEISIELYATDNGGNYPSNSDTTGLGEYLFKNIKNPYDNSPHWLTTSDPAEIGEVLLWTDAAGSHYSIKGMGKGGYIDLEYDR